MDVKHHEGKNRQKISQLSTAGGGFEPRTHKRMHTGCQTQRRQSLLITTPVTILKSISVTFTTRCIVGRNEADLFGHVYL